VGRAGLSDERITHHYEKEGSKAELVGDSLQEAEKNARPPTRFKAL